MYYLVDVALRIAYALGVEDVLSIEDRDVHSEKASCSGPLLQVFASCTIALWLKCIMINRAN